MAKGKGKISSKSQQGHYQTYEASNRCVRNRTARLERHVKKNPDDHQAMKALSKGLEYRRKKPLSWTKMWRPAAIRLAHNLRRVGLNGKLAFKYLAQQYAIFK